MMMIDVAQAQARLLALAGTTPVETVPLADAAGRWAADDVTAKRDQPAADLSAMDGYAIRFADLPGPWRVIGEVAAGGGATREIASGEAMRIFTGAPMPPGADTVLIQENATADGGGLRLTGDAPDHEGLHVRRAGGDFTNGETLVARGERLTPARIALIAAGGHGAVAVHRRPRVALIATGDELVPPGAPAPGTLLPASNGPMLAAMLAATGALVTDLGIVPDRLEAIAAALADAARSADIVVTTGGASVGDHDLVRPALASMGAPPDFWRVAMKPGKPLMAGRLGDAVLLGLPGNPVSSFVTGHLFLLPLAAAMAGAARPLPRLTGARLVGPLPATGNRAEYLRAQRIDGEVAVLHEQSSAGLVALAQADALIVRAPGSRAAAAGDEAEILTIA